MSRRDELIAKYAADIETKCGIKPDMTLLMQVTIGCGPSIYQDDASTVSATDPAELERIERNFLIRKLGLSAGPELGIGIQAALTTYGRSNRNKYRAVMYYLLVKHFGREEAYR
ncbi:MAG: hypothetical protein ACD_23C00054G0006 [uncultured bacterium]|nr:MAG: hypothetical protein ACD_23C00054G0006 [uncultured bacterium]